MINTWRRAACELYRCAGAAHKMAPATHLYWQRRRDVRGSAGRTLWEIEKGLNFGLSQPVSARRAHLPTSITVPPRPLAPWEEAFLCPQTVMHQATHTAVYARTQQDPEVRLPHCPCAHEVGCQLRLSALFTACFRSFYFRSVFFSFFPFCLSMWARKLTLSFQISISKLNTREKRPSSLYSLK